MAAFEPQKEEKEISAQMTEREAQNRERALRILELKRIQRELSMDPSTSGG